MLIVMKSKLINVRLEAEDAGKVRALKERGVELSAIVRKAIRSEYSRRVVSPAHTDAAQVLREIYATYPAAPAPRRTFDVHDRRSFAAAIGRHVRRTSR
jgi:hypothetical protein